MYKDADPFEEVKKQIDIVTKKADIDSDVAVQGYGKVGYATAKSLNELSCKIIALSDTKGCIVNQNGIDPQKAKEFKNKTGSIYGLEGCNKIPLNDLLEIDCDILVPARGENGKVI